MKTLTFTITAKQQGKRCDMALADLATESAETLSRTRIQQLIAQGAVTHGTSVLASVKQKVSSGEVYTIALPKAVAAQPKAEKITLAIVHEDKDVLVINKPAGMVVHPAAGNHAGTLVNALLAHCGKSLSGIGGVARPGIVHRLDKDTSGLMVIAKNDKAHQALSSQFADRSLSRTYLALVWGVPKPGRGKIEGRIGRHPKNRKKMAVLAGAGREALTYYQTKEVFGENTTLLSCTLATGRTHQIRVHLAHLGYPVVGDPVYGKRRPNAQRFPSLALFSRQALHAETLSFIHPRSGQVCRFTAPLPDDMQKLLKSLKKLR